MSVNAILWAHLRPPSPLPAAASRYAHSPISCMDICLTLAGLQVRSLRVSGPPDGVSWRSDSRRLARCTSVGLFKQLSCAWSGLLCQMLPSISPATPASSRAASSSSPRSTAGWRAQTSGAALRERLGHRSAVSSPGWGPEGALLASGSREGAIRVWGLPGE
jgi:hypothetical protein